MFSFLDVEALKKAHNKFTHAHKYPSSPFKFTFCLDGLLQDCCISAWAEVGSSSHSSLIPESLRDNTDYSMLTKYPISALSYTKV